MLKHFGLADLIVYTLCFQQTMLGHLLWDFFLLPINTFTFDIEASSKFTNTQSESSMQLAFYKC